MFGSSNDILLITIAVCIALFTLFSCWGIFYIVMIIRRAFKMVKGVEDVIAGFNDLIKTTKQKMEHSAAYISVLSEGVKRAIELGKDSFGVDNKKKSKKSKK